MTIRDKGFWQNEKKSICKKLAFLVKNFNLLFLQKFLTFSQSFSKKTFRINLFREKYIKKYIQGMSQKKCDFRRLVQKCNFFSCNSSVWCFFNIFWKFVFFLVLYWPKKNQRTFFSFKIKSSEKQKCVNKLFLSKSKILKRLNHRI